MTTDLSSKSVEEIVKDGKDRMGSFGYWRRAANELARRLEEAQQRNAAHDAKVATEAKAEALEEAKALVLKRGEQIGDLQRQLAEDKAEIDRLADARDECGAANVKLKKEIDAMRPMIEACKARHEVHSYYEFAPCYCLTCQWYRDYLHRKQP